MKPQKSPLIQLALVLLAITVSVGGGVFFFRRYSDTQLTKDQLERENGILDNRIQVLSSSSEELSQHVDTAYRSIPETNAGLFAINTIKNIEGSEEIFIDGVYVKSSLTEEGQQQKSEVGFEVEGNTGQVFNYLFNLSRSLPILKLIELETRVTEDEFATATVSMEAYSQALPQKLPSLKEALPTVSEEERELLSELASFEYPALTAEQPTSEESGSGNFGRENPFSPITTTQATAEE